VRVIRGALARAVAAAASIDDVRRRPGVARGVAVQYFDIARREAVDRALRDIPIQRLQQSTSGRLRINALESAGYGSVYDVAHASPYQLRQVPGVGEQTATQAIAAARQVATAVSETSPVVIDVRQPGTSDCELLRAVGAWEAAETGWNEHGAHLERVAAELARLAEAARPAAQRVRSLLRSRAARDAAAGAAQGLLSLLESDDPQRVTDQIDLEVRRVAALDDRAIVADYERRAATYQARLGELGDIGLDVDAMQGGLPSELAERVASMELDGAFLKASLRGYQAFGAKFALVQRRVVVGDEMGLGKTVEALAAMAHLRSLGSTHFVVVCPASVTINWVREVHQHTRLEATKVHGPDRHAALSTWLQRGGVAVTTYETLRSLAPPPELDDLAMLVVDEAHYVKNPEALRTRAVRTWGGAAARVLYLTGTPMENRVEEFQSIVSHLQPDVASRLTGEHGIIDPRSFRTAVAPAYLRRNQDDVLAELPSRIETLDWLEMTDADLAAYRTAVTERSFMAMRRAAFASGTPDSSSKLRRLVEIADEAADADHKVVVFSYFRDVVSAVMTSLGDRVLGPITGSVRPSERQALVDELTLSSGHRVLVSQIEAGGTGLNIQAASVVVLCEPQWKPSIEDQAIARAHRMGQVRPVQVHRLLTSPGVDERMRQVIEMKARLIDDYARRSETAEASPDALDISEVEAARAVASEAEAERIIIEQEAERLDLDLMPERFRA
jgi:superfamily II DNA or RNA helicase